MSESITFAVPEPASKPHELADKPFEHDRQPWARHPSNAFVLCQDGEGAVEGSWYAARVLNISLHGVALKIFRPFDFGTILVLEASAGRFGLTKLSHRARVVHVRPTSGEWIVGCEFLNRLTETELQALLP